MAFASTTEVQARLDWDLDAGELKVCTGALEDLTEWAKFHGRSTWTDETVPAFIKTLVIRAAARFMRNYEGYQQSRAGDETVIFRDQSEGAGSAEFTKYEVTAIRRLVNPQQGFGSIGVLAWDSLPQSTVDTAGRVGPLGGDRFPLFSGADEW